MTIQENQIIGELVAQDYRTAAVFKKYNIDFCCQGNRTLSDACESKKIDEKVVIAELNALLTSQSEGSTDYQNWPLDLLADYIERKHHRYVEEKTQEIIPYLDKIARVHGQRHPELLEINEHFKATAGELAMHMKKEELMIFPYIKKLVKAQEDNSQVVKPNFESVKYPIQAMMDDHTTEGERFRKIEALSNNYTPPEDGCATYRVTFALLKEFEQDLHLHIHLENNILFPKAIELEKLLN
jgi:regulator of cell morphogenesis and NO signaling